MKKKLALMFLVSSFFVFPILGNASEKELFIESKEIPKEIEHYTKNSWHAGIEAQAYLTKENSSDFTLGKGFTIGSDVGEQNVFYYPIMSKSNDVKYIFEVGQSDNGIITFNVNSFWSEELNSVVDNSSEENPVSIIEHNGRLFYENNDETHLLKDNFLPSSVGVPYETPSSAKSNETSNVVNVVEVNDQAAIQTRAATPQPEINMDMVWDFPIWEQQTTIPWCGAYATAGVINYLEEAYFEPFTDGETVARFHFPNETLEQLKTHGTPARGTETYAKSLGYKNTKFELRKFSYEEVKTHVKKFDPMVAQLTPKNKPQSLLRSKPQTGGDHAIDILGYLEPPQGSPQPKIVYIWNPWWQMATPMSYVEDGTMLLSGTHYLWSYTTANFR